MPTVGFLQQQVDHKGSRKNVRQEIGDLAGLAPQRQIFAVAFSLGLLIPAPGTNASVQLHSLGPSFEKLHTTQAYAPRPAHERTGNARVAE